MEDSVWKVDNSKGGFQFVYICKPIYAEKGRERIHFSEISEFVGNCVSSREN